MERDYDAQLLESVAVRRQRLGDALLHGSLRTLRRAGYTLRRAVGWSFLQRQLDQQQRRLVPSTRAPAPPLAR